MKKSTYFFIGKLSDQLARYQIQEMFLKNGFRIEIFLNGISIWGSTNKNFSEIMSEVKETFNIIISAFVLRTNKPITYSLVNWVELKEKISKKNIIGWLFPPFSKIKPYSQKSRNNLDWKKSIWLFNNLKPNNGNHILALKDYYSAITDTSEDAFLFAFRSIEDVCRSINKCSEIKSKHWRKMHKTINTSEKQIEPLTEISQIVRHGNKNHKGVVKARKNREVLLKISQDVLRKEFTRSFPKFIQ